MCFSKSQSIINTILLTLGSIYVLPKYRLSIPLFFLALKDLIQTLQYHYLNKKDIEKKIAVFSWIHICFQPLFVNIFMSYFSKDDYNYWKNIFVICFLYGLYTLTTLYEFDIQNEPDCKTKNIKNDFCAKHTTSYMGEYHIAYKFRRDNDILFFPILYFVLMFLPSLLSNSRSLSIIWGIFIITIYTYFNKIGEGEKAAIWCFLSIIFYLPIAIFNDKISELII